MKQGLQTIGLVALVAWTALGGYAWMKVKRQVVVTIEENAGDADDELALLGDRLDALSGDLDALVGSLGENFGLLASAVEDGALAAEADRTGVERRLARIEAALVAAREARELGADERALVEPPIAPPGTSARAGVADSAPITAEPGPSPAAASAKKSFLAFRIPSRDFRFEGLQGFELLEDLSRVGFDARSTLHDFTGVSNRVRGRFRVDLAHPGDGIEGRVEIAASSLDTDLSGRDEAMLEHLDAGRFEHVVFEATDLASAVADIENRRLSGSLKGRMTIRGVTREVSMPVTAHVDESRRLVVEGEMKLLLSDYGVPVPNKLGVISMEDEVRVWIHLRARTRVEEVGR